MNMSDGFFDSGPFMPHGGCYLWTHSLIALHVISDAFIVLAYYSIPITLVYFVQKRKDLRFHWMFISFAVFILACGTTHLMEIWNVWHANYWLSGSIKAVTALASVPTALLLVKLIPTALQLPSPSELQLANAQLRALSARMQSVREEEAMRIAREIHDELGQRLTGLKMDLLWTERKLGEISGSPSINAILDRVVGATELVDGIMATVQEIATELRPGVLDKLGLGSALHAETRRFQKRSGIAFETHLPTNEPILSSGRSTALFRIFQECLTNIGRHSRASKVDVELSEENGRVTMRVKDNGRGITEAELGSPNSLGLMGMKERAALVGGVIFFERGADGGTIVTAGVPSQAITEKGSYEARADR